jgi:RNA polymerase sigma factor (sigma-70 family)
VLSTQSDERLVDLVRAGSDPAFEAIVERYRRALMRYVSRLLPPERAEDVVQQALVKAYEAMRRDAAELNLKPWLYRIAHNGALNALRDRALIHSELDDRIDGVERPDQAFERNLGLRELVVAVQALPERQRAAILLRELEGRSYGEIAAALGVTDGAVRQLLNRARNSLRSAAAALVPMPLVTRLAAGESTEPVTARIGELMGMGGSALAMKLCATALVTGAVVGGATVIPDGGRDQPNGAPVAEAAEAADESDGGEDSDSGIGRSGGGGGASLEDRGGETLSGERSGTGAAGGERDGGDRAVDRSIDRDRDDDGHSGRGGGSGGGDGHSGVGGGSGDDGHSGPGGVTTDDGVDNHSGPGGGDVAPSEPADELEEASEDHSGPGGGGSSGPGSGDSGSLTSSGALVPELDSSGPGSGSPAP